MSRDWKRGDVAFIPGVGRVLLVGAGDAFVTEAGCHRNIKRFLGIRPLLVVDPDDQEQMERLWVALQDSLGRSSRADLTAAVRSLLTPPRPSEPQGLGAVVETGNLNTHIHVGDGRWFRFGDPDQRTCEYNDLAVVRVLWEGVQL